MIGLSHNLFDQVFHFSIVVMNKETPSDNVTIQMLSLSLHLWRPTYLFYLYFILYIIYTTNIYENFGGKAFAWVSIGVSILHEKFNLSTQKIFYAQVLYSTLYYVCSCKSAWISNSNKFYLSMDMEKCRIKFVKFWGL